MGQSALQSWSSVQQLGCAAADAVCWAAPQQHKSRWADVSRAGLQERAAEGKQAERDIPALTKCIEKLGEQLHQEEQVSPAASALVTGCKKSSALVLAAHKHPPKSSPYYRDCSKLCD